MRLERLGGESERRRIRAQGRFGSLPLQTIIRLNFDELQGDSWNLCHTGFLEAVRLLIDPLALRLGAVEKGSTLLLTGHSAGAAIASLLYTHIATTKISSLAKVTERFENVHCILFGAPPISIAPLQEHDRWRPSPQGSLFLSLINEGDPITNADAEYIKKKYRWLKLPWPYPYTARDLCCGSQTNPVSTKIANLGKRLFVNSGTLLLMRTNGLDMSRVSIRRVENYELDEDAVMTWRVHGIKLYKERVISVVGTSGASGTEGSVGDTLDFHNVALSGYRYMEDIAENMWITLLFL